MTTSPVKAITVVQNRADLALALAELRDQGGDIALVPTMGALHAGHRSLIEVAHEHASHVVVTIFVNPLQFRPGEDFQRYPRQLETDFAVCADAGASLVFAPDPSEMYQSGQPLITVDPGPLGSVLEGASRPGHFSGVLTVVAKLFHLIQPTVALFGEKDYQQLALIRQMVIDLNFPVEIVPVPTVRDVDGLALSSRNAFLTESERVAALGLSRALRAGQAVASHGKSAVIQAAQQALSVSVAHDNSVELDYLEVRNSDLGPAPEFGPARLLIAAQVGGTRLIDNVGIHLGSDDKEGALRS